MTADGAGGSQEDGLECHTGEGQQEPRQAFKEELDHAIICITVSFLPVSQELG